MKKLNVSQLLSTWLPVVPIALGLTIAPNQAQAARPLGIDVSSYQGHPTWSSVKGSGIVFAWAKATEGTGLTDADYAYNTSNGKAAGVYMGAYDFTHPASNTPGAEANYFWGVAGANIKADGKSLQPMLDMEVFSGVTGASSYSDWVNQWCNSIVSKAASGGAVVKPAIYFSACHGNEFGSSISTWYNDVANYNGQSSQTGTPWSVCASEDPWGSSRWNFWQYTSTGTIPGISGNVDHDVYNGTLAGLQGAMIPVATGYPNYAFSSTAQGWTSGNGLTAVSWTATSPWPGIIYADQNAADAYFYGPATGFTGATNPSVNVNIYTQGTNSVHDMQLFWKTAASNTWSAARSTPVVNYTAAGVWTRINLDDNSPGWTGDLINQLRLDVDQTSHSNRFLIDHVVVQTTDRYTFDTTVQGWTSGHSLTAISWTGTSGWPGVFYADQTNNDAYFYGPTGMGYWGANNDRVHVRIYPQSGSSGGVHDAQLFWTTSADATWTASKSSEIVTYCGNDKYCDIYFNVGRNTFWNGNNNGGGNGGSISQLRLDVDQTNHAERWLVDSVVIEHVKFDLPYIVTQPANSSVPAGNNAVFSVVGHGGNSGLSYQWWKIGSNQTNGPTVIAGATSSSLTITNAQPTDATNYQVQVSNQASWINSAVVTLTVTTNANIPPTITAQPQPLTVVQGQSAAFSVTNTGAAPLSYQWNFNGGAISGATASSYTVASAQPTDVGSYAVVVTNPYGSASSDNAALVVNIPPTISTQPAGLTVNGGDDAAFSVVATGTDPLTYQWAFNGTEIPAATDPSYTVTSAQLSDAGNYTVVIVNVAGTNTSATAALTVNSPATVVTDPTDLTVNQGQSAAFSVTADGTAPLTYQWTFNGGNISGATTTGYTIASAQATDIGSYAVVVNNAFGSATSTDAVLLVNIPPAITAPPASENVNQGTAASFSVAVTGTDPLAYQWNKNGAAIAGATDSSYAIASAQASDSGSYTVVVTNIAGTISSANAVLTVNIPPSITTQPVNQSVNQGQNAVFSVVVAGTAPLAYQWRLNTLSILGATDSSYTRVNCQSSDVGSYSVQVTNIVGSVLSTDALLTVNTPPIINTQPQSQLASVSNSVVFSVSASGTAPIGYQWKKNGTAISGATLSSLTLTALKWTNAGSYTVVITNFVGSVTSATAVLTIQQAAFTFVDAFESYTLGALDRNYASGPNTGLTNPWWGVATLPNFTVFGTTGGVTPHGGTKMVGAKTNGSIEQVYVNIPYRLNAGSNYFGNIMCDWWFYDTKGAAAGASNYNDYIALARNQPVSLTNDVVTTTFTNFSQRMSLGAYNGTGAHSNVYQARLVGATGGFNANGWFNTTTPRTIGWHHGRMIVGIPVANSGPVQMFIDNMTNAVFSYATSGTNVGFNLIELNCAFGTINSGGYFDDFSFRAANAPWIAQQPVSTTVATGGNTSFTTVAIGTAYQWQLNGANISGATATSYPVTGATAGDAGTYNCVITGANGTMNTTAVTLTVQ